MWQSNLSVLPQDLGWTLFEGCGCGVNNDHYRVQSTCKVEILCDDSRVDEIVAQLIELFVLPEAPQGFAGNEEGRDQGIIVVDTVDTFIKIRDHSTYNEQDLTS